MARCTSHHFQPLHWKFWPKALFPQNVKVRKQTLIHIQWETLVMSSFSKLVSRLVQNFDKSSLPKFTFSKTNSNLFSECEHLVWYLIKKKQQTNGSNNDYKLLTKSPCNTVPTTCNKIIGVCTYFYGVSKYHFEKYFSSFQNIISKTKTFAQPKRRRSQEGMWEEDLQVYVGWLL